MSQKGESRKQLKALLKKDLRLLFRKRVAIFIFGGPFILMFLLIGLPGLFGTQQSMILLICTDDIEYNGVNIGESLVGNISSYYSHDQTIDVEEVGNLSKVQQTEDFGVYIPSNFSVLTFTYSEINATPFPVYYFVDAAQSLFSDSIFGTIQAIANNVIATVFANRTIPAINRIEVPPSSIPEELILGPKAAAIAMPLSYMIFLLIALNSSSYSNIGFAREKRMRTMEVLLAYSKKHSHLIISKTVTALVASLGTTLSYVLGIVVATRVAGTTQEGIFEVFGLNMSILGAGDIVIMFIFVVMALLISTLITMAIDCNISREASERLSPLVSIGLAMFFYFVSLATPLTSSTTLMINPFYWCYRIVLLLIAGKFSSEILIFGFLILGLIATLVYLATRGIQKEKSLYME